MTKEIIVKSHPKYISQFQKGFPLLNKENVTTSIQDLQDGDIIRLVDNNNHFIAKGYAGIQNKGIGWLLTWKEHEDIDKDFICKKLQAAINQRLHFYYSEDTTAFRIFNGEGDGFGGLTIDYFDGYYLIQWYSEGAYSFHEEVMEALRELTDFKGVYQKKRFAQEGKYVEEDDFVEGTRPTFPLLVKENGVKFAIYLNDGAMVGVFLDQREVRKKIRDAYSEGKRVLNTFSYTGAFSVFAALGGAIETTSVDLANRSLSKTIEQFSINDIDYEAQNIIVEDVFKYFKYAIKKELSFDLVILDPPSFARSKKHTFSAAKDYKNLLKEAIAITEKGGTIVASTNCSTFNMKKFKGFIQTAFKETNGKYEILEEYTLPEDFKTLRQYKQSDYLKVAFIRKL
ncbi:MULTISPECIES: class I SAM-dependent rRNA methyltransferase [Bacillaceae]|uniref:class I SAM-dependent rRNA methyltransferase n=1 Tax=Bacillaceae TaxID=186817 RepID=UPI001C57DB9A|nr:class I SAM-dependent rRNA methyltransferase [Rossellomorea sp. YZS02]MBW3114421.1 class I SAM-dependent rRNA methyltransferase [Bacillus sp. MCCB 382]MDX8344458.1 class I SAM-dependent rRNA methyltransferase [Rossellomorea sp. YZS02]